MHRSLQQFIQTLRHHEVRVSTAESLDAMRVLALMGYDDRAGLKSALSATLAKTIEDKSRFDYCFELFYGSETATSALKNTNEKKQQSLLPNTKSEPEKNMAPEVREAISNPLVSQMLQEDTVALTTSIAEAVNQLPEKDLQFFTQINPTTTKIMQQLNNSQIEESMADLNEIDSEEAEALIEQLQQARANLRNQIRDQVEARFLLTANQKGKQLREDSLLNSSLSAIEKHYAKDMQQLINKLAKKLLAKHKQRLHVDKRSKLDVTQTLRKNIRNDGILFQTYWKKTRRQKPKIMVMCDVSNSVSTHARFLLLFLYGIAEALPRVRSFCFTNKTGEVTDIFAKQDCATAIDIALETWGRGGSDYGGSFEDFAQLTDGDIDRQTTLIILGDARNNFGNPRLEILQKLYKSCKTVLWLNPERRSNWGSGDSEMRRYQSAVHNGFECRNIRQLERFVDQLLRQHR